MTDSAVLQFLADSSWNIVSENAAPHACMEMRALRASWLRALNDVGKTENWARAKAAGLWMRAP